MINTLNWTWHLLAAINKRPSMNETGDAYFYHSGRTTCPIPPSTDHQNAPYTLGSIYERSSGGQRKQKKTKKKHLLLRLKATLPKSMKRFHIQFPGQTESQTTPICK